MAVQAQYPSNVRLFNRADQEHREMDCSHPTDRFLDQSVFMSNGANGMGRKRPREALPLGLNLAFEDQNHVNPALVSSSSSTSSMLSTALAGDLAARLERQKDEMDRFVAAQGEQLRRALTERWRRHQQELRRAAEEAAGRRLREKEAELERAAKRNVELETHLARLRAESMAWQAQAQMNQAAAATLQAQLQQASAQCVESGEAEDEGSAHVDPGRAEREADCRACRACQAHPASVVVVPCRHLCLCAGCAGAADACPVCGCVLTGSVQVFLS